MHLRGIISSTYLTVTESSEVHNSPLPPKERFVVQTANRFRPINEFQTHHDYITNFFSRLSWHHGKWGMVAKNRGGRQYPGIIFAISPLKLVGCHFIEARMEPGVSRASSVGVGAMDIEEWWQKKGRMKIFRHHRVYRFSKGGRTPLRQISGWNGGIEGFMRTYLQNGLTPPYLTVKQVIFQCNWGKQKYWETWSWSEKIAIYHVSRGINNGIILYHYYHMQDLCIGCIGKDVQTNATW